MKKNKIKNAIISVSDKTNIVDFANFLISLNIKIFSTDGTAKLLKKNKIPVVEISQYTKFPEIMGGRVKTLNPKIHGGILARRGIDDAVAKKNKIELFDMLVVNLYPFKKIISKKNCSLKKALENIDIGGPTMLRAGAKNFENVVVISDPKDYNVFKKEIEEKKYITKKIRLDFSKKVFKKISNYDKEIFNYLKTKNS